MSENYFNNETAEKSFGFKVILTLVALMTLSIVFMKVYSIPTMNVAPDPTLKQDPVWYPIMVIIMGILTLLGLWKTFQYKKWGVYLVTVSLFVMIILNPEFSLLYTLAPLFTLFVFVGYGLFEIIPKWQFFK